MTIRPVLAAEAIGTGILLAPVVGSVFVDTRLLGSSPASALTPERKQARV